MTSEEKIIELLGELKGSVSELKGDVNTLQRDVTIVKLDLENRMEPQIQSLAEGQKTLMETLAPKSRLEALEDEMVFMKSVIRSLSKEIAELKAAR